MPVEFVDTPEMNLLRLAVRVRRAQVEYFRSKNQASLYRALDLERDFDRQLLKLLGPAGDVHQPGSKERLL